MVKNLQDYLKTGRDPAYLKNGDTITEELARDMPYLFVKSSVALNLS